MPKVGKKHFPYTEAGKKAAKRYAKKKGKGATIKTKKNPGVMVYSHSELDVYRRLAKLFESDWIQGAVNPKHKGYCTPMTKKTCTPKRKALAKRFKKAARKKKKKGGSGWQGKV